MQEKEPSVAAAQLLAEAERRARELLRANLSAEGILASRPTPRAEGRRYTSIFGRDAAICALGMAASGEARTDRRRPGRAADPGPAPGGQRPDPQVRRPASGEVDFWYAGCIDATLWWLIAVACSTGWCPAAASAGSWREQVAQARSLARLPGAPAVAPAAAERGERLGRHHAPLRLRPLQQRPLVLGQAALRPRRARSRPATSPTSSSIPSAAQSPASAGCGC